MLIITISVEHLCKIAVLFIYATKLAVLCHRHVHAWCYWFSVDFFMMLNDDKVTKRRKAWVSNIISFKTMKNLNIKNRWMTLSGWFILFIYLFLPTIRLILLVERIGEMEKNNEGWDLVNRYPIRWLVWVQACNFWLIVGPNRFPTTEKLAAYVVFNYVVKWKYERVHII